MKIVVVDAHTLNPGDLSWSSLKELGECVFCERTSPDEFLARVADADAILTNKTPVRRDAIEQLTSLKYIGVTATGFNIVDIQAARERGVVVCNAPAYGTLSVAQMAMGHVLNLANGVALHTADVRHEGWSQSPDWCYWRTPLMELTGKTMGIIGLGQIGQATARLALGFGMRVLAVTRSPKGLPEIEEVGLQRLVAESDVISLHCPLTPETEGMFDAALISQMKPTAFLINTGRGQLVDSGALAAALNQGRIAGAGIDTLEQEPPYAAHPLVHAKNCYVTPHIAWATREARQRLLDIVVDNVRKFVHNAPQNVVSG